MALPGQVTDARVLSSSGHPALDRQARKAARRGVVGSEPGWHLSEQTGRARATYRISTVGRAEEIRIQVTEGGPAWGDPLRDILQSHDLSDYPGPTVQVPIRFTLD